MVVRVEPIDVSSCAGSLAYRSIRKLTKPSDLGEHMANLAAVPPTGAFLHAVPIAWVGGATFPVRAYLMVFE